jgi:hypothetical protein
MRIMPPQPSIPGGDHYEDRLVRARIKHQWDPSAREVRDPACADGKTPVIYPT